MKNLKILGYGFIISLFFLLSGCSKSTSVVSSCVECNLTPNAGPCKALITKYYYSQEEKKCKEFAWGGCNGVVPFDTKEECEACKCND